MPKLKELLSEFTGTCFLLMIVVGSGIMGQNLSEQNILILLGNTIATGTGLMVLIWIFMQSSGSHFNPAVSFIFYLSKEITSLQLISYILVQIVGAITGVVLAHYMFNLDLFQLSGNYRSGINIYFAESVATFGLILTILRVKELNQILVAPAVGLYITAGYWFTSSTSFANPAVTIARSFTDTFTGINLDNVIFFIAFQFIGATLALGLNKLIEESKA